METAIEQKSIQVKEDGQILRQSNELVDLAKHLVIKDDVTFNQAFELEKTLKAFIDGPGTYHDEEIDIANRLHKLLCDKRNAILNHVKLAWKELKDRRAAYQDEQQRKVEEAKRKAEAEAAKKEAEKQAAIQAKIDEENRKIREAEEAERKKQAEEQARIKAVKDKEEKARLEREAEARRQAESQRMEDEKRRAAEKTASLEEKKANVYVAPKPVPTVAAPAGASLNYEYEPVVENKNLVPEQYKVIDIAMLKRMQKAAKGTMVVPGVRFVRKAIGVSRGAA